MSTLNPERLLVQKMARESGLTVKQGSLLVMCQCRRALRRRNTRMCKLCRSEQPKKKRLKPTLYQRHVVRAFIEEETMDRAAARLRIDRHTVWRHLNKVCRFAGIKASRRERTRGMIGLVKWAFNSGLMANKL